MTKAIYLGQTNRVSADNQRLVRVGRKIFVGFIAFLMAILAKIKKIRVIAKIRKMVGVYDQRVFWPGSVICLGLAILTIMIIAEDHAKPHDLGSLLFMNCFIFYLFYGLLLPITKKDANGQSHWL